MTGLSAHQLALRKDKLTGSTIAAYLGFNPYCSPLEQWELNAGLREFQGNEDTVAGNELERALGDWACKDLGVTDAVWDAGTLVHPRETYFAATPDVILPSECSGIQIKNHRPIVARKYLGKPGANGKWDNALVPLHINMQMQWELLICSSVYGWPLGARYWLLVSYFGGGERRIYWIRQDASLTAGLILAGRKFWKQHLDPSGPHTPPTDWPWKAKPAKEHRKLKLSPAELAAAPIPFSPSGNDPLAIKIPFL